jgi:hypothetical protein
MKKDRKKEKLWWWQLETDHHKTRISNKAGNVHITMRHVHATIVAVETQ